MKHRQMREKAVVDFDAEHWFGKTLIGWILAVATTFFVLLFVAGLSLLLYAQASAHEGAGLHMHSYEWSNHPSGGIQMRGEAHQSVPCKAFQQVSIQFEIFNKTTGDLVGTTRTPRMDGLFVYDEVAWIVHNAPDISVEPKTPLYARYTFFGKTKDGDCI